MRQLEHRFNGIEEQIAAEAELDLVVPFTTPDLTRAALKAANGMAAGLNAHVRLVKVQLVPYPLDLEQSPVFLEFLQDQLDQFHSTLPLDTEIRLAREFEPELEGALRTNSIVVLASPQRLWRTNNERLAATLRAHGHKVVLMSK